jgi:hypothetical protein
MTISELTCEHCGTQVKGSFQTPGLFQLSAEQLQFVEVFVRCRGNIKEVEKDLKISYPTVRARLDQVIGTMGYPVSPDRGDSDSAIATDVLNALENGDLSFDEALQKLRGEKS